MLWDLRRAERTSSSMISAGRAAFDNAMRVVEEIRAGGGTAMADPADVADFEEVSEWLHAPKRMWGRVDILVNNAGVLRDKTFAKMDMADFEFVLRVHLMGSANCTKAVWAGMRERNYGRIVLTSSASGIYGNFGQANYGAAKAAMIGLMNVLHLEGAKNDIRVNILAPTARTGMTEGLLSPVAAELMTPESVTPGVLFLVSENAPSRVILGAGAGVFAVTHIGETPGISSTRASARPRRSPPGSPRFPMRRPPSRSRTPSPRPTSSSPPRPRRRVSSWSEKCGRAL